VQDQGDRDARKLRSSLHHISVQNELLRTEIEGLRDALLTKKRQNKKGKALDLQQRQEYHGGATFWSPRKIREARYREKVLQQEKEEEQLAKAEAKELQQAARLYKQKIAEEKRVAREAAKVAKAQAKADEAAAKEAEKAAHNASKPIQTSQKGKRKASRAPTSSNKRRSLGGGAAASAEVPSAAPAAPTRTTHLPKKYK
tara:strand:+ start:996 stop:1595 length:600 start_codon:yes stop_codon:yes gene_type:complete